MTFADVKSPVILTVLSIFATGWIALYWVMANRVSAAEAAAVELHGQQGLSIQAMDRRQSDVLQGINSTLATMNGTLEKLEERSLHQGKALDQIQKSIQKLAFPNPPQQ